MISIAGLTIDNYSQNTPRKIRKTPNGLEKQSPRSYQNMMLADKIGFCIEEKIWGIKIQKLADRIYIFK